MIDFLKLLWRLDRFMSSPIYGKAKEAVEEIRRDRVLRTFAAKEGSPQFCPYCGQRPWGDARHHEAFLRVHEQLPINQRSASTNFAIELALWLRGDGL